MSQNDGEVKAKGKKKAKGEKPKLELHVAPRAGARASREVVACLGGAPFVDVLDTSRASARARFVARLVARWKVDEALLDGVDDLLVAKAREADEQAEEAAKEAAAEGNGEGAAQKALDEAPEEVV